MHIKLDLNDAPVIRGFKDFETANRNAIRDTLNIGVAQTRRNAIEKIKRDFTLRNDFTVKSIAFDKATGNDINSMEAKVGSLERAYFMETQEMGGTRRHGKGGGKTIKAAIGMTKAREGESSARKVSQAYYIRKIRPRLVKGNFSKQGLSPKARSVAQMYVANKYGLFINRGHNIFKINSFAKAGKNSFRVKFEHFYSIHQSTIHIKKHKWLEPSTVKPARDLPFIYKSQLRKQWKTGPEKL